MRIVFGVVFFLIAAFGVLLGVIYPLVANSEQGYELARLQAFPQLRENDAVTFEATLPATEERVLVRIEIATSASLLDRGDDVVLALTASREGRTEIAEVFRLEGGTPIDAGTSTEKVFLLDAGALYFIRDTPYSFVVTKGDADIELSRVELILIGGTYDYDAGVPPIGYGLMLIGSAGFFLSNRRPRAQKPPPRWGRG